MTDRHLLQWEIRKDRNAYPSGPLAKDKAVYTFTGWEGCHRGRLLLTAEEADFVRDRLTTAFKVDDAERCQTCDGTGMEARHQLCRDCDDTPTNDPNGGPQNG